MTRATIRAENSSVVPKPTDTILIATAAPPPIHSKKLDLKPGEIVEIKDAEQVLATLDSEGKLDGLPFMPEMRQYCGRRFRVARRGDSTCVAGHPRRMENAVYLESLRCDGSAHQGCGAACLLLWKESWLVRVTDPAANGHSKVEAPSPGIFNPPTSLVNGSSDCGLNGHGAKHDGSDGFPELDAKDDNVNGALVCQATALNSATCPLNLGNPARYLAGVVRDYRSAKIGFDDLRNLVRYLRGKLILGAFKTWARAPWNDQRYRKTPAERLNLQIGELVQVRSAREIMATLDRNGCNRGMEFKAEMFQFCGRRFPVLGRMQRRIDERTGLMREFQNECILLVGVHCQGQRSFCARSNYHYWREIWLRRC